MSTATAPAFTAAAWEQALAEHRLAAARCTQCGATYLPPRALCPACHSQAMAWVELSGRARLAAFTSIFVGPSAMVAKGFDRANPYITAIVELEEGPRLSARVVGLDARAPALEWIGTPLQVTFIDAAQEGGRTEPAFAPAAPAAGEPG